MKKSQLLCCSLTLLLSLSGCASLNTGTADGFSMQDFFADSLITAITGVESSEGNPAACNQMKMDCPAANFSQRSINGEVRCSCKR